MQNSVAENSSQRRVGLDDSVATPLPATSNIDFAQIDQLHRSEAGRGHVPALDGIRAAAAILVFLGHATILSGICALDRWVYHLLHLNGLGAQVFFVLSGFLITETLLKADPHPRYSILNFWARRGLRLLPLYYLLLTYALVVRPLISTALHWAPVDTPANEWMYWAGLSNFAIFEAGKYQYGYIDQTWSLAIEFQFYVIWPIVMFLLRPRQVAAFGVILFLVSMFYRVMAGFVWDTPPISIYVSSISRAGAFGLGAFVAVALRNPSLLLKLRPYATVAAISVFPAVWGTMAYEEFVANDLLGYPDARGGRLTYSVLNTWMVIGVCGLLLRTLAASRDGRLHRWFGSRLLTGFAKYSYAFFLVHVTVILAIMNRLWAPAGRSPHKAYSWPIILGSELPAQLVFYVLAFAVSFGVAFLAWHLYEKHWLKLSRFFPSRPPAPPAATTLIAITAPSAAATPAATPVATTPAP